MLSDTQRQQVKEKILSEIESSLELITSLKENSKPVSPDNAIGRLSRMEAINDQNMLQANLRSTEARVARLKQTLAQIDEEDFGLCVQCEEPIPFGRLLLIPESKTCVRCAS
jgi:DnaK suppressor protein